MLDQKRDKTKARLRKARKALRELRKGLDAPPMDKMVREPNKKKEIWELLAERENNIHSGSGIS